MKVIEGIQFLQAHNNQDMASFIRDEMPQMSDEQLQALAHINELIAKQIDALQRFRSSKISGLYSVCQVLNEHLQNRFLTGTIENDIAMIEDDEDDEY